MKPNKKFSKIIKETANEHQVTPKKVVNEIQKTIELTWSNPDPKIKAAQQKLFPNGKPSVEEFIRTIATHAKQRLKTIS